MSRGREALAVAVSAFVGLAVAVAAVWYVTGSADLFYEQLFRVRPTVEGGGVGADWTAGNASPWLAALIKITHAVDVLMGVFILFMVFVHWGIFQRLATRMREPYDRRDADGVATDGGTGVSDGVDGTGPSDGDGGESR
ncbi:hypothetical protein ACFQPA_15160 [Halomarina halobia]|uniref:Uncharacterized protein n=1 Tax=Halomarina halobia TaxID=3033386 RepID=A0ABD6A8G4_9EURY|nr:hypothetical protein [Halomarina sp. PSR21]